MKCDYCGRGIRSEEEKIKKDLEDAIRLTQEARRLRRQANILSLIALGLSVVSLVIRIMKCIGRW